jgi:hypothetical protein
MNKPSILVSIGDLLPGDQMQVGRDLNFTIKSVALLGVRDAFYEVRFQEMTYSVSLPKKAMVLKISTK